MLMTGNQISAKKNHLNLDTIYHIFQLVNYHFHSYSFNKFHKTCVQL